VEGGLLRLPAIAEAPRCREAIVSTARIAGSRARTLSATDSAIVNRAAGRSAQPCRITQRPCFVVGKVGFLVCDTRPADKAVGSGGASRHCLARTLC
jgi:hypothetical protein